MKVMKKIIKILIMLIVILLAIIIYKKVSLNKSIENNIEIKGDLITDNVHAVTLKENENDNINSDVIDDKEIYYIYGIEDNKVLYKYNIYSGEKEKLLDNINYYECKKYNDLIGCTNNENTYLYNSKGKLELTLKGINIAYYGNNYYSINTNGKIYDKNEKEIFSLSKDYEGYELIDNVNIKGNIYLLYSNFDTNKNIICNVKNNTCEENKLTAYSKYENGIYTISNDKVKVYDLVSNKYNEYAISINRENSYINYLYNNNLYVYNNNLERLEIINLTKDEIKTYNVKNVSSISIVDNKIFLKLINNKYDYYIIDENYTFKSFTTEEYINEINNELTNKINDIKNKYNVNLYIKDKAIIKSPDFLAKEYDELGGIYSSINTVENILSKLTKDFYDSLYENDYKGLNIYLTGELKPADASSQNFDPAGYTSVYENMYLIALNISQIPLETYVCHELMHTIENKLKSKGEYFSEWSTFNPKKYEYSYSYKVTNRTEYTIGVTADDNVYFVDYYSHTFPAEDMARVFESICFEGKDSNIKKYSHLLEKGKYLKETLYKYYPSLENTSLFEAIE